MRAPFQIIAIPYKKDNNSLFYCIFHRADYNQWQFIAGGGEDDESPQNAAKREVFEEGGITSDQWIRLKSLAYLPADVISEKDRMHWDGDICVIPEYAFGFECNADIKLSREHTECIWLPYREAMEKLSWDSNRTALYELNFRLLNGLKTK